MYAQPWGKVLLLEEKRDEGGFRGRVTSTLSGNLFSGGPAQSGFAVGRLDRRLGRGSLD